MCVSGRRLAERVVGEDEQLVLVEGMQSTDPGSEQPSTEPGVHERRHRIQLRPIDQRF